MHKSRFFLLLLSLLLVMGLSHTGAQDSAPLLIADGTLRRIQVPILMYHYVSSLPQNADKLRAGLTVEPNAFREQMAYLHDAGYHTVSLYQLRAALLAGAALPALPVVLTFDDGYIDHYLNVFPLLRQYGFTATFFIITGRIDSADAAYMTWPQIEEMAKAGMSMESHTQRHLDLRERDYDFLVYEILGSQQTLQAHTAREVRMFSYPAGQYDDNTLAVLATTTIWNAVTTQPGALQTSDNTLEMPRVRVSASTTLRAFAAALRAR